MNEYRKMGQIVLWMLVVSCAAATVQQVESQNSSLDAVSAKLVDSVKICEAGSHVVVGSSSCLLCPAGTYSSSTSSASECAACPAGSYAAFIGSTRCTTLPTVGDITLFAGTYTTAYHLNAGDGGPATLAVMAGPSSVAVDNTRGKVYITSADEHHVSDIRYCNRTTHSP